MSNSEFGLEEIIWNRKQNRS